MASKLFLSTSPPLPSLPVFPRKYMSLRSATISCQLQNEPAKGLTRPTVGFEPTLWGDRFANNVPDKPKVLDRDEEKCVSKMKEYVRRELVAITTGNPSKTMKFIEDIQRLGVGYHFELEIEEALTHVYETYHDDEVNGNLDDLYDVSLRFRLLRQQGFNISCDIFNKFKDEDGKLNESLAEDIQGMLGLYEAAHMAKHGEDIFDEAIVFTTARLRDAIETNPGLQANPPLLSLVKHALVHPIRKNPGRLEARYYMSVYDQFESYDKQLLKFAKTDFNTVQSLYTKELSDLTGWWNDLNLTARLPFGIVRDRLVEAHLWSVGIIPEPQYSYGRMAVTKVGKLITYIDDVFDSYGTLTELELFADAFERWDINCKDQLPEYMQIIYEATLDVFAEIEEDMIKQGKPCYYAHYAKQTIKNATKGYLQEAKWRHEEYVPTMEEYKSNGFLTSLGHLFIFIPFLGVEEVATKETLEWFFGTPRALRASCLMVRLRNDVVSHEREREATNIATGVECYMKEYGVSEKEAYEGIRDIILSEWKHLNGECLEFRNRVVPKYLLSMLVNQASIIEVYYLEGNDGYTLITTQGMKARIESVFVHPAPV